MPEPVAKKSALGRAAVQLRERMSSGDPSEPPARSAILIVNGFDRHSVNSFEIDEARSFPWIELCLRQLRRHTPAADYEVLVWDNSFLPEHLEIMRSDTKVSVFSNPEGKDVRHGRALDRLLGKVPEGVDHVVTLDTDSFPIRDGWLDNIIGRLEGGASLAGVWRDEMAPRIDPYVHPSCLAARVETLRELGVAFARKQGHRVDVGQQITNALLERGDRISRLRRSNARNMHFLMGGVYGDLVYHHGAGSRQASFWTSFNLEADAAVRIALRDAAFDDLDALIQFLTADEVIPPLSPAPEPSS